MVDTIRTETDLLANLFQDGQAASSISENDLRDLIVSLRSNQGTGWAFYVDDENGTEGSAVAISADVRTQVTNDGASSLTNLTQAGTMGAVWNTSIDRIDPAQDGDAYDVRISFNIKTASGASGQSIELDLDIGGAPGIVLDETRPLLKGANVTQSFVFAWTVFVADPFLANGGTFNMTPSVDVTCWGSRILITRLHTPTT